MTDPAQRFLIVRLSSIGDIVHALPAAAALAETFPQAQIHWVVEKRYALLLEGNPHLHRIVVLDTLGWRRHLTSSATWHEIRNGVSDLRQTLYNAALDFQGLWKSAVVAWLSRAQRTHWICRALAARAQRGGSLHPAGFTAASTSTWWKRTWRWSNGWERARNAGSFPCRGTMKMTHTWTAQLAALDAGRLHHHEPGRWLALEMLVAGELRSAHPAIGRRAAAIKSF